MNPGSSKSIALYLATELITGAEASLLMARIEVSLSNFKLSFRLPVNFIMGCFCLQLYSLIWRTWCFFYSIVIFRHCWTVCSFSNVTWIHLNNWGIITGAVSICMFHLSALDWSHVTLKPWILDFHPLKNHTCRQPYWWAIEAYSNIIHPVATNYWIINLVSLFIISGDGAC